MDIYQKVLELNDRQTEIGLRLQVKDSASKYFGGIMDPETGIPRANHVGSASYVPTWAASLFNGRFFLLLAGATASVS